MIDINGLYFFYYFSLYGMRKFYNWDLNVILVFFGLFELNIYEKFKNVKDIYFFIGGYRYDGLKFYIDFEDGKVYFCKCRDVLFFLVWDLFEDMFLFEFKRIFIFYDDRGRMFVLSEKILLI